MNREHTITIQQANLYGLVLMLPVFVITAIPFFLVNGFAIPSPSLVKSLLFGVAMVVGIVIHELLHGIAWAFGQSKGWKAVTFGFNREWLTPYCHCNQPVSVWVYRLGALAPLIVLGLMPLLISYYNGLFNLWLFGSIFSIAAVGDMIAVWMIRKLKGKSKVLDHPEKLGFIQLN